MENAVQALKMAAAALVFILALGSSFYMFDYIVEKVIARIIRISWDQNYPIYKPYN